MSKIPVKIGNLENEGILEMPEVLLNVATIY
jgi:hypothetical protein